VVSCCFRIPIAFSLLNKNRRQTVPEDSTVQTLTLNGNQP